ncbi:MAG: hypothetical protein AAB471_01810 [Patescibacteria group bacterium]
MGKKNKTGPSGVGFEKSKSEKIYDLILWRLKTDPCEKVPKKKKDAPRAVCGKMCKMRVSFLFILPLWGIRIICQWPAVLYRLRNIGWLRATLNLLNGTIKTRHVWRVFLRFPTEKIQCAKRSNPTLLFLLW